MSVVALAGVAITGWALLFGFSLVTVTLVAGLALGVLCAAERLAPVSFGVGQATFEFGGVPIVCAIALGGPACGLLAAAPSAIYRDPRRSAFQGAALALQVLAGSLAFRLFPPAPLLVQHEFSAAFVWGTLAAGAAFFGLDALIGPFLMRLKYALSWREVLREVILPAFPSDALAIATTLATALAVVFAGAPAALILLSGTLLSLAATNLIRDYQKRALRLQAENEALRESLSESNLELARRLVGKLGLRDEQAAARAAASAVYAGDLAREMGLGEERARQVRLGALLMDVGLLWVPDEVLLTPPDRLNSLGRARLEEHTLHGEEVLGGVPGLEEVARWVRWHHEREDGTGYPDRLRGRWLPLEAKILAVASHHASLVLGEPGAPRLSPDEARRELVDLADGGLDGLVVKAFLRVLDAGDENYAAAADDRFTFECLYPDVSRSTSIDRQIISR